MNAMNANIKGARAGIFDSPRLETDRSGQFELPVVEAPESFRPELKGTGDVKAIQRADPEFCPMPAGQVRAEIESLFRHIDPKPQSFALVILQLAVQLLCFRRAELSTKHVLRYCVCPFRAVKGREPQAWGRQNALPRFRGVLVVNVQ